MLLILIEKLSFLQRVTPIVIATPTCHRPIIRLLSEQLFFGQLTRPFPSVAVGWVWLRETMWVAQCVQCY